MGDYPAAAFQSEAAELPAELTDAIGRDLEETPEEYLARTAAALDASDVVEALTNDGVDILGSRLDGTELVVNVAPDADAGTREAVEASGAVVELGAPAVPDFSGARLDALAELIGGQGFSFTTKDYTFVCSVAFNGRNRSTSANVFLTAGHCIEPERTFGNDFWESRQTNAGAPPMRGAVLGTPIESQFKFGNNADVGAVATNTAVWNPLPKVGTWGGGLGSLWSGAPYSVTDSTNGVVGSPVCKSGRTTGWTCGSILVVNESYPVYNHSSTPTYVNLTLTDVCMRSGDSGAAASIGSSAFGIGVAGDWVANCDRGSQPNAISAFFPIATTNGSTSVASALPDWELSVEVATPTVVRPSFTGDAIRGTLPNGGPRHTITVTIDGTPYTVSPDSSGAWSLAIPAALRTGAHTFTVRAGWGTFSRSATISDSYNLQPKPTVQRITGPDRYDVAIQISRQAYPGTARTVYLANGANYPDALSAAPAAVHTGGPLLLTATDRLSDAAITEIRRLAPSSIVIVGGAASVSDAVLQSAQQLAPEVRRIAGSGRFETSQAVITDAFRTGASGVFVATGYNFPDALSASAAAGSSDVPVLLVPGSDATLDESSKTIIRLLGAQRATIAGGPNSVSAGIATSLASTVPGTVRRLDGSDRFAASIAINRASVSRSSTVYLATGYNFPDALAGGVLAGVRDAPLYIVPGDCVPRGVISDITSLGAGNVTLLGGPNSLGSSVESLSACSW